MKVLLIGDSQELKKDVPFFVQLRWPDARILSAPSGSRVTELIDSESPDVAIADARLPDVTRLEMVTRVRESSDIPLVVLVDGVDSLKAEVLEAGADDYFASPCNALDVLSKLTALYRRTHGNGSARSRSMLVCGEISISRSAREVLLSGKAIKLTPHEYSLLVLLATNAGRVLTHRTLLEKAWGPQYAADLAILKKYIHRLRKKLSDHSGHPQTILTHRGVGYMLNRGA